MLRIARQCVLKLASFFSIPEQNHEKFSLQVKERDMSSFQEVSGNKNLYDEFHLDTVLPPQLQDNDGNMQIMDANGDPQML